MYREDPYTPYLDSSLDFLHVWTPLRLYVFFSKNEAQGAGAREGGAGQSRVIGPARGGGCFHIFGKKTTDSPRGLHT